MGYKLKSHRGAAKRIRFSSTGKVKRDKAFGSHLLTSKNGKRMRRLTSSADCSAACTRMLHTILPYK